MRKREGGTDLPSGALDEASLGVKSIEGDEPRLTHCACKSRKVQ